MYGKCGVRRRIWAFGEINEQVRFYSYRCEALKLEWVQKFNL